MYGLGELSGHILERAVVETLESRRLLSLVVAAEGDPADTGEPVDGSEVVVTDGDFEVTMINDDGSSPCPEPVDENGDPLYCILESSAGTPAPPPTLIDGTLTVTGTAGDDKIRISIARDTSKLAVKVNGTVTLFSKADITKIKVDGLAGDDFICIKQHHGGINIATELNGGDGDDRICGGDGNDLISGSAGKDKLRGNAGDDVLSGGDGNDKLFGGRGDDSVIGNDGSDKVRGGGGSDVLDGSKGRDKIHGGSGKDNCLDIDAMIDAKKAEKNNGQTRLAGGEDDGEGDPNGDLMPIWWDPENPDSPPPVDTGTEQIVIDDGSGVLPSDSPEALIMY